MILYSAAIFYNPLSFGTLYTLSETVLNIDGLYDRKRYLLAIRYAIDNFNV